METDAKKIASGGKWGYIGSQPNGKTKIPVESVRCFSPRKSLARPKTTSDFERPSSVAYSCTGIFVGRWRIPMKKLVWLALFASLSVMIATPVTCVFRKGRES